MLGEIQHCLRVETNLFRNRCQRLLLVAAVIFNRGIDYASCIGNKVRDTQDAMLVQCALIRKAAESDCHLLLRNRI